MQFYSTWLVLKRLLLALDRLPLRRTFAASAGSVDAFAVEAQRHSSRARYKIFSRQMESLLHLRNELNALQFAQSAARLLCASRCAPRGRRDSISSKRRNDGKDFAMVNDQSAQGHPAYASAHAPRSFIEDLLGAGMA